MSERYLDIDKEVMLGFLQEGYTTVRQVHGCRATIRLAKCPLPDDALLVGADFWPYEGRLRLRITSATFADEDHGTHVEPPSYCIEYEEGNP